MLTIFYENHIPTSTEITISGDNAHHAIKVLRIKINEIIRISDGSNEYCDIEVSKITGATFTGKILKRYEIKPRTQKLVAIQALPKSDRTKEMIELLVEAGVDEISPWQSSRSIGKLSDNWLSKWEQSIRAASAQSRRVLLPKISSEFSGEFTQLVGEDKLLLVFHESGVQKFSNWQESLVKDELEKYSQISFLIGPEGGLTETEIENAKAAGGVILTLGEEVFRSAHAGIAVASIINFLLKRY